MTKRKRHFSSEDDSDIDLPFWKSKDPLAVMGRELLLVSKVDIEKYIEDKSDACDGELAKRIHDELVGNLSGRKVEDSELSPQLRRKAGLWANARPKRTRVEE